MSWFSWLMGSEPEPAIQFVGPPTGTLTLDEYFMGRDLAYMDELTGAIRVNAHDLVERVNRLLGLYGSTPPVNSGWRPKAVNDATPGAAKNSRHLTGQAVDLQDRDGKLKAWCMAHLDDLDRIGLWMEDGRDTRTWCHLQNVAPWSGVRIFRA